MEKKKLVVNEMTISLYTLLCTLMMVLFQTFTKLTRFYSTAIYLMLISLVMIGSFVALKQWEEKSRKYTYAFLGFLGMIYFFTDMTYGSVDFKRALGGPFLYAIWPIIFLCASNICTKKHLKFMAILVLISINLSSLFTLQGGMQYENASRILAGNADELFASMGIGGYGYIYGIVFLNYALWFCVRNATKKYVKIYFLGTVALNYAAIVYSAYSTAILFSIILFVVANIPFDKENRWKILLIGIVFGIAYLFRLQMFELIKSIGQSLKLEWIEIRMNQLISATQSGDYEDLRRVRLYTKSLKMFFESPLLGHGEYASVGGHSTGIDYLARYGLWGITFLWLNIAAFSTWKTVLQKKEHMLFFIVFVTFTYVNTCMSKAIPCMVFFVVPLLLLIFNKNEEEQEASSDEENDQTQKKQPMFRTYLR